ncbi:hypothetical protein NC652_002007 [Populus alba x Populus x berolinensis]|nr:hypothetical protein NC652_002007 [Populus alba x Populus x berolinensis]
MECLLPLLLLAFEVSLDPYLSLLQRSFCYDVLLANCSSVILQSSHIYIYNTMEFIEDLSIGF